MYEYGTLKPVEVNLEVGGGIGRIMERMNQTRVHCTHIWKYHRKNLVQIL
jgi:hypothetical protein